MKSEQVNELFAALAVAQSAMKSAAKDSENPHFRTKYADLASVWNAIREPLSKNGLSVVQLPGVDSLETILGHKSGQFISIETPIKSLKNDAQGYGSGLTYARRYALAAITGIAQDDDDGNEASAPQNQKRQYNAQPPADATAEQARGAMVNAQKREASENDRPAFNDRIKIEVARIGVERVLETCKAHGYKDPDAVLPKDFGNVLKATKEIV